MLGPSCWFFPKLTASEGTPLHAVPRASLSTPFHGQEPRQAASSLQRSLPLTGQDWVAGIGAGLHAGKLATLATRMFVLCTGGAPGRCTC